MSTPTPATKAHHYRAVEEDRAATEDLFLSHQATREARDTLADWLEGQAEEQATKSRDFGRGFAEAVRVLREAPTQCHSCSPPRTLGETVACPDCGALWRMALYGMSWVPGGTPGSTR